MTILSQIQSLPVTQSILTTIGLLDGSSSEAFRQVCQGRYYETIVPVTLKAHMLSDIDQGHLCTSIMAKAQLISVIDLLGRATIATTCLSHGLSALHDFRDAWQAKTWTAPLTSTISGSVHLAIAVAVGYVLVFFPFRPFDLAEFASITTH